MAKSKTDFSFRNPAVTLTGITVLAALAWGAVVALEPKGAQKKR